MILIIIANYLSTRDSSLGKNFDFYIVNGILGNLTFNDNTLFQIS